jgi:hypothetical protein
MFINPMYQVGVQHNLALAYAGSQLVNTTPTLETICNVVGDYFASLLVPATSIASTAQVITQRTEVSKGIALMARYNGISNLFNSGLFTLAQLNLMNSLLNFDRSYSKNDYESYFEQWEQYIYGYSSMTEMEKYPLYAGVSVGKASAAYWSNEIANLGTSNWAQWIPNQQAGENELPKWLKADIKGAIIGLVASGGNLLGAVGYAAGNSIAEVVLDLLFPPTVD